VVVKSVGLAACECFRTGSTVEAAKTVLAERFRASKTAIDLSPLLRSLRNADLIASIDGRPIPEISAPSLYSAYRHFLRFDIAPALLRVAYRRLPVSAGKALACRVQRLDMAGALWPRALEAERNFLRCPLPDRPRIGRRRFAAAYFHHLIRNIVDFQAIEAMTPAQAECWFDRYIDTEGLQHLERAKSSKQPVIVAGFHFSATKLLTLLLMRYGYDTTQVWLPDGTFDKSVVERWRAEYRKIRPDFGRFGNIPDFTLPSFRRLLESLRASEVLVWYGDVFPQKQEFQEQASRVFCVTDFQSGLNQSRLEVDICGQPVYLTSWIGAFARLTKAVVVPAALIRLGAKMKLLFRPALALPDRATAKDSEVLNRALYHELNLLLRQYPDQWFGWHSLNPVRQTEAPVFQPAGGCDELAFAGQGMSIGKGGENK
jgi:lauroyl/myristoyl acyltransferase